MLNRTLLGGILILSLGTFGCGAGLSPRPIKMDAELGRVIVYRNGVAYFERTAHVTNGKLTITVPAERVDDFLKSLTIIDTQTGKTLPVAFPTRLDRGSQVELEISVPRGARNVRLSYVTESPAWKPSYRLVLSDAGAARLEAWAVVDNVSGEDWQDVVVGVGSTTALSFRYDLHSVRHVQRETLSDDNRVAHAPPTGGSPYQTTSGNAEVVGNIAFDELNRFEQLDASQKRAVLISGEIDTKRKATAARGQAQHSNSVPGAGHGVGSLSGRSTGGGSGLSGLAEQLKNSKQRVRVEGYAQSTDKDQRGASLERANKLRNALIENGVPPEQLEAVGTGQVSSQAARVLALADPKPAQAKTAPEASSEPMGTAYFVAPHKLSIEKDASAMVNVLTAKVDAQRVYYYDPISARGSKKFAFRAVRLENPSEHTLEPGPFTVYSQGQFLGEGLSDPIPPKSAAFVPYALDREIIVDPAIETRQELERLITIERGIVTAEARHIRSTKLSLVNRGREAQIVYVRHLVAPGWKLDAGKQKVEKLRGAHLFPVRIAPRSSAELVIEETQPSTERVDIHTTAGVDAIGLFLETTRELDPELRKKLDEIVKMHRAMHDVQTRIDTLRAQMATLRERIDEIHVQLVTLRRVGTAQRLSQNLAKKMEEISDRLQKSTIEVTDLEGNLMTSRITIQDRLAELSLSRHKSGESKALAASPKP